MNGMPYTPLMDKRSNEVESFVRQQCFLGKTRERKQERDIDCKAASMSLRCNMDLKCLLKAQTWLSN